MSKNHILIIGAAGFIGKNVADIFLQERFKIRALDIFLPPNVEKNIEWVVGSAQDEVTFASAAHGCSHVIYLAGGGLPASGNNNMAAEIQQHVKTVVKAAEICRDMGVKTFVFASSGGTVYGNNPNIPLKENYITQPLTAYGASKVSIEHYLRIIGSVSEMRTISLRISNPYGEGQHANKNQGFVAAAMAAAMNNEVLEIWGDGSVIRDFIHVRDVAQAFLSTCRYDGHSGIYNIGSGEGTSIRQLIALLEDVCDVKIKTKFMTSRSIDVRANILDVSKASSDLKWKPHISLDQGLRQTFSWWKIK